MAYLLIALGSAIGGVTRYWCSGWVAARTHAAFPFGTLFVNVVGSFLIGAAFAALEPSDKLALTNELRTSINQFFMIGVLGGFTTFSSFSLQTLTLLRQQEWLSASTNIVSSLVLCLVAVWLGYWLIAK